MSVTRSRHPGALAAALLILVTALFAVLLPLWQAIPAALGGAAGVLLLRAWLARSGVLLTAAAFIAGFAAMAAFTYLAGAGWGIWAWLGFTPAAIVASLFVAGFALMALSGGLNLLPASPVRRAVRCALLGGASFFLASGSLLLLAWDNWVE